MTTQEQVKPINSAKEQIRQTRIQKLTELADKGINPYPYVFEKNANASDLQEKYKDLPEGEETEEMDGQVYRRLLEAILTNISLKNNLDHLLAG